MTHPGGTGGITGMRFIVTGAASGIGAEVAKQLGERGARVVCVDRDGASLRDAVSRIPGVGHDARCFDLTEIGAIPALTESIFAAGAVVGVVHAAGIHSIQPIRLLSPERYREVFAVNTEAGLALARSMCNRRSNPIDGGSIVMVSSMMALVGSPGATAYSMSKAALVGLSKSLAIELAPRKIRINCVAPGFVRTAMYERVSKLWSPEQLALIEAQHPLGIGQPEDVAAAIVFLLGDTGRWITGSVMCVDGGYTAQ